VGVRQIKQARAIATIVSVQNRYSLTDRTHEDVVDYCEKEGVGFIPWYPLAAGDVVGKRTIERIAAHLGVTSAQLAIAWLLARTKVMLPIPGTSQTSHLDENVAAAAVKLDAKVMKELRKI
jgi:aryl-alcohol dehydrogenase-like predicted oxidoreductase